MCVCVYVCVDTAQEKKHNKKEQHALLLTLSGGVTESGTAAACNSCRSVTVYRLQFRLRALLLLLLALALALSLT